MTPAQLFRSTLGIAPEGFGVVHQIGDDTRMVSFYWDGKTLLVSFGPTLGNLYFDDATLELWAKNAKDWFRNFNLKKVLGVHEGFLREWEGLEAEVRAQITIHQPTKLLIAGFSQGSAHATLALRALDMPAECHAFATPRVFGWIAGATYDNWLTVNKQVSLTRYNHRRDPVQHTPFGIQGFAHVGHSVKLGTPGWWDFAKYHDPTAYTNELDKLQ